MAPTATDITIEHYSRPEVKEIILNHTLRQDCSWRALNGDFHQWYRYLENDNVRLLNATEDYDHIIGQHRTLYASLNVFEASLREVKRNKLDVTSDNPLGTPADTVGYTLAVDIDHGPGSKFEECLQALEDAAQFLVDYLKQNGIHQSVWVLFSGGGIYVEIHDQICRSNSQEPQDRSTFFEMLTDRFNRLIGHVAEEFFKAHPDHLSKVKFDALNNSKRVFKCILSIHKNKPYAVTPLNGDAIKIDLERARLPLKEDMIAETRNWYSTYDIAEREPLFRLLDEFKETEEGHKAKHHFKEIWRSPFKVVAKYFPPCIRHIIDTVNLGEGKTRFAGVLSAFLYQMGWTEEEAWSLITAVSDRNGLLNPKHIFDSCYGRINCPSCQKIQSDSAGYPHLGMKGLGVCQPTEECCLWPGDYAIAYAFGDMQTENSKVELAKGPTVLDALRTLLENEKDAFVDPNFDKWEWSQNRLLIAHVIEEGYISKTEEERLHKFLKQYTISLKKYGVDYSNLWAVPRKPESKKEEFDWPIKARAWKVLRTGNPLQYVADSCGRTVLEAEIAFKKLACCISAQNVNQTAGMHPKLSGESSGGKTITVYNFAHHMPEEMVIKGSMSSKAGFYHNDGDRVFRILDDYSAGNEDLDTVIKQTTSEFHSPYIHRTVIKNAPVTLTIGKEQIWCVTSVDGSLDIQVLNRQIPINVNDSVDATKKVNAGTIKRYANGELQMPVDESVLVCRAMFQILRDQGYINIRVPFGDRIEWLDTSNRRNPSIFMDLLISITAMNRFQREKDDAGYYLATEQDFQDAKALFTDKDAEELVKRLTSRERDTVDLLIANSEGLTRDQMAEKLNVATERVTQIINGRNGKGGLKQKIQLNETKISETIRINDDTKRTVHKIIYSLKNYDRFSGFEAVVRLNPESSEPAKQDKHELSNELTIQTDNSKDDISKIRKKEKERGRRKRDECLYDAGVEPISKNQKMLSSLSSTMADSESECLAQCYPWFGANHDTVLCQSAEDVVRCLDKHLNEISTPLLHEWLSSHGWSYIIVTCQLQERGWKLDLETRTLRKPEIQQFYNKL